MKTAVKQPKVLAFEIHDKFRGDSARIVKRTTKKGIHQQVLNGHLRPRLEWIKLEDLNPLETQRETNESWVTKRLEDRRGVDMLALGALSVALDPEDNEYYVWDGCGRWAVVKANGALTEVPCLVYDITRAQAAFYFAYNQDRGRRSLSKEVIFVNAWTSGDHEALIWGQRLSTLGCYIEGSTGYAVPHPQQPGQVEIRYRALVEGYKIASGDMALQRQARDMIVQAWATTTSGCNVIHQDVYWALLEIFKRLPEMRKNSLNKTFSSFLAWVAQGKKQDGAANEWKVKGLSGNANVSRQLAVGLFTAFQSSQFWKPQFNNTVSLKKLQD
jgi:hypothetical protein